ncbi:MAG: helix-turn-helix domain-containing protein [Methanobacteriota archaeon]
MKFLSVKQAAEYLSFSPKTIRRMIQSGKLPACKISGEFRIDQEDLKKSIESAQVRPIINGSE